MSLNSSEVISLREVCGSTPAEGAQPAEGTLPRKATKPLAPQALKHKIQEKSEKTKILYIFERVFENKDVSLRRKCILGSKNREGYE
jgi:hypothetical protein